MAIGNRTGTETNRAATNAENNPADEPRYKLPPQSERRAWIHDTHGHTVVVSLTGQLYVLRGRILLTPDSPEYVAVTRWYLRHVEHKDAADNYTREAHERGKL